MHKEISFTKILVLNFFDFSHEDSLVCPVSTDENHFRVRNINNNSRIVCNKHQFPGGPFF